MNAGTTHTGRTQRRADPRCAADPHHAADEAAHGAGRAGAGPLVYLDANILLSQYLRSVFLDLADAGLLRAHWGRQVLEEVRRNLLEPSIARTAAQAEKRYDPLSPIFRYA